MKTLKDKKYKLNEIIAYRKNQNVFMDEDVTQAILEFETWLESIDYEIDIEKVFDKHKEIFGDFKND